MSVVTYQVSCVGYHFFLSFLHESVLAIRFITKPLQVMGLIKQRQFKKMYLDKLLPFRLCVLYFGFLGWIQTPYHRMWTVSVPEHLDGPLLPLL